MPKRGRFRARDSTDEFVEAFNFSVASRLSYRRRAFYFAVPSQPELSTLQAARRPGPAVASHFASASASDERKSASTAQPTPGVPSAGSIATAKH